MTQVSEIQANEDALVAKVTAIRSHYVEYERLTAIKADLRRLLNRDNKASEGGCMLLVGQSGSGKTKLIDDFVQDYPRKPHGLVDENGDKADHAPIICAKVPDNTLKALVEALYRAFTEMVAPSRMTRAEMAESVIYYARKMETRLLILEEAHQAIEKKSDAKAYDVGVFIKHLTNECQFSVVIVGTDEARRIVETNPELERRTLQVHELRPFDWSVPTERRAFRGLLGTFDEKLKDVFGVSSNLTDPDTALRVYQATGGVVGQVAKLLENAGVLAARDAAENPGQGVTIEHLKTAWGNARVRVKKERPNPFDGTFVAGVAAVPQDTSAVPVKVKTRKAGGDVNFRP